MERKSRKTICVTALSALMLAAGIQSASATGVVDASAVYQTAMVYGIVTDAAGPVAGAAVQVVDSNVGVVTDENGRFELDVEPGTVLVVSCLGYKDLSVIAMPDMNIVLTEDATALDEVVVTALGIKRDRKALGCVPYGFLSILSL